MNKRSSLAQLAPGASIEQARALAKGFAERLAVEQYAPATWSAYESDWRIFSSWCAEIHRAALPATPETVVLFLAAQASRGYAPTTLERRLAAIRFMHHQARRCSPCDSIQVAVVLRGIFNARGQDRRRKKTAEHDQVERMADAADPRTLQGLRDRAMLLFGFATGLRRSELVALDIECVEEREGGLSVRIGRCKKGENSGGHVIEVSRVPDSRYCPVQALWTWRAAAHVGRGALFRRIRRGDRVTSSRLTGRSVAQAVKRLAQKAGLNPSHYAAHSLRAGFLKNAARDTTRNSDAAPLG